MKESKCIKDIIYIKYTKSISHNKLEKYIINRLNKINSSLIKNTKINWSNFDRNPYPLNELRKIIKEKNGELISDNYIDSQTKVKIKCSNNHIFQMTPNNLKAKHWCAVCAGQVGMTIEDLKLLVEKRNGKLISKKYINAHTKVKVRCNNNHIFKMTPTHLRLGQWCSMCSGRAKKTIEYICSFAKQNNGICYSSVYVNNSTKMKWGCLKCGSMWKRSYNKMYNRKYFCSKCQKILKKINM